MRTKKEWKGKYVHPGKRQRDPKEPNKSQRIPQKQNKKRNLDEKKNKPQIHNTKT